MQRCHLPKTSGQAPTARSPPRHTFRDAPEAAWLPADAAAGASSRGASPQGLRERKCSEEFFHVDESTLEKAFRRNGLGFVITAPERVFQEGPRTRDCLLLNKSLLILSDL